MVRLLELLYQFYFVLVHWERKSSQITLRFTLMFDLLSCFQMGYEFDTWPVSPKVSTRAASWLKAARVFFFPVIRAALV